MERVYKTLQRRYRKANLTFGQGLTEKGETRKINHVFVKLMVLERGDLKSAFQNPTFGTAQEALRRTEHVFTEVSRSAATARRCVELSEIFPDSASDDDSFRVLLLASAGCGKTTLLMKYCPLMWANGELWSGKFDLLICGELRNEEVRCAEDIGGLLGGWGRVGLMNVEDRQSLVDFIADRPHRICLILDGLDETQFESCSNYVKDILRGEELHGVRLILTSRPCDDAFTLCEKYPFRTRLEIVGFLPADVEKYVRCVLSEEQATELLHVLAEDMHLANVMSTPYFAARVCELFKWSTRIPRCVSDIHELMILQIASSRREKSFANWKDLPSDFQKHVLDLGEFAFRMLLAERLCFSESEIMAHSLSKDAVLLGMLVTCEPDLLVGRERQYRFSHLILQEFLSALFVALSGQLYPGKIAKIVEALGALSGHLNTFWQLLASPLDSECMDCLCMALLFCRHKPPTVNEVESLLFDRCPIPSEVQEALCSLLPLRSMEALARRLLDGRVAGDAVTAIENKMQCSRISNNSGFLRTLLAVWLRMSPKAHVGELLENVNMIDSGTASLCCEIANIDVATFGSICSLIPDIDLPYGCHPQFFALKDIVFRCFMEYTRSAVPPAHHLPVRTIAQVLARSDFCIRSNNSQADCYTREHVLKHHSDDVRRVDAIMLGCHSWHWSLYNQVIKSSSLTSLCISVPGDKDFLQPYLPRNDNMEEAGFRKVPSRSLWTIAIAIDKWPSLRKVTVTIDDPDCTTDGEATTFLSAVGRHGSLVIVSVGYWATLAMHPYFRLCDQNSYPSTIQRQFIQ